MESTQDLAVYLVPPSDHRLYSVGSSVLGWDNRREVRVPRPALPGISDEQLATWVGPAEFFGIHATIGDALRVPTVMRSQVVDELRTIAREFPAIRLSGGRFFNRGEFFSPNTLVATYDDSSGALLALHSEVVARFNRLARGSGYWDYREDPRWTPKQRWRIERYYAPFILDAFQFHFTFASSLAGPEAVDRLHRAVVDVTGLFSQPSDTTLLLSEAWLFEKRSDGYWRLAEAFPFASRR